jgi:hypothetical protein
MIGFRAHRTADCRDLNEPMPDGLSAGCWWHPVPGGPGRLLRKTGSLTVGDIERVLVCP